MNKEDFLNYLCFKYLILNYSVKELVEMFDGYNSDEPYEMFYDLIVSTQEIDPDFLVIDDEIVTKIQSLISEYRFRDEYRINNDFYDVMFNDVIVYLNQQKAEADKNKEFTRAKFRAKEIRKRNIHVGDFDALLGIISMDYEIYVNVLNNECDTMTELFLGEATNYFLESCPDIYNNEVVYNNTLTMLNSIDFNTIPKKAEKHIKKIIKRMDNLK